MRKFSFLFCLPVIVCICLSCKKTDTAQVGPPSLYNIKWSDYSDNPILTKADSGSEYGAYFGRILFDDGKFKMWYANSFGNDKYNIGYAESVNGFKWTIIKHTVIDVGPEGSWDSYSVHPGAIIKEGNVYKMYYCGQSRPNDVLDKRIGLATSADGINWTRSTLETVNQINLKGYTTDILKFNNTYFLYYGNADVIGVATSTNGLDWIKAAGSVITASSAWEGSRIWSCSVIRDENNFRMVYTTSLMNAFGYAESNDGINWIKGDYPVFDIFKTEGFSNNVRYPFLRKFDRSYYLFYSTVSSSYECTIRAAKASY